MVMRWPIDQLGWVLGLRQRRPFKLRLGPCPKRTARSGDDDALDRGGIFAHQRLKHGGMFAVDWQDARAMPRGLCHQKRACGDKRFLVGQGQRGPLGQRTKARFQPCRAHDGGHNPIGGAAGRVDQGLGACCDLGSTALERRAQILQTVVIGRDGQFGAQCARLRGQPRYIAPAS